MNIKLTADRMYHKLSHEADWYLKKELKGCHVVLDLGCGFDSPISKLHNILKIGVDVCDEYLQQCQKNKTHHVIVKSNLLDLELSKNTVDAAILVNVIEHNNWNDSLYIIDKAEKWASKKVIIITPSGYVPFDSQDANPYMSHRTGWTTDQLRRLGYKVRGISGLKYLRHRSRWEPKIKPIFWGGVIIGLSQPFCWFLPQFAHLLLAVKEKESFAFNITL